MPLPTDLKAWRPLLETLQQGVLLADAHGRFVQANPGASRILGLDLDALLDRGVGDPRWKGIDEDGVPLAPDAFPGAETLRTRVPFRNRVVGLLQDEQDPLWLEFSGGPLPNGGVLLTFDDITERQRTEAVLEARARIVAVGGDGNLEQVLRATLDEGERLTNSRIGFFHFLGEDQQTLSLQAWSTRTSASFCQAEAHGAHYPVDQAGVWVDAVRERRPVIHNDYASLPRRRGMPEGHAEVIRELVVPVFRGDRIVAILGLGNKPGPYGPTDVETLQQLADLAWETADRIRMAQELADREASLRSLVSNIPGAVYRCDILPPWRMSMCSEGFLEVTGHSPEDFLLRGVTYAGLVHPEDLERLSQEVDAGVQGHRNFQMEYRILPPDGSIRWVLERGKAAYGADGEPKWLEGVILDISERKQAEESLRKASAAVDQSPTPVVITDTDGRIEYVNGAFTRSTGYSAEEALGQNPRILKSGEQDEDFYLQLWGTLTAGRTWQGRLHNKRKSGELYWEQATISPLRDASGRITHYVAAKEDITARLRSEEALRSSEALLRTLAEHAPDQILLLDGEGRIRYINHPLPGCTEAEMLGRRWLDWLPEGSKEAARAAFAQVLGTGRPAEYWFEGAGPFGEQRWYECRITPVLEQERVDGLVLFATDVTQNRKDQIRVNDALEFNQALLGTMPLGAAAYHAESGRCVMVNQAMASLVGATPEQFRAKDFRSIPAYRATGMLAAAEQALATGDLQYVEVKVTSTFGKACWLACYFSRFTGGGEPHLLVLASDISPRKLADEALQSSESLYRELLERQGEGFAMADAEERFLVVNPVAERIFGVAPGTLAGRSMLEFLPPDQQSVVHGQTLLRSDGAHSTYELRILRPDGSQRTILVTATPRARTAQEPLQVIGVFRDITDEKESHDALRASEARFRTLVEQAGDGFELWDGEGRLVDANGSTCRALGYSKEELLGLSLSDIDPEATLEEHQRQFRELLGKPPITFESVHRRRDGTTFPVEITASVIQVGEHRRAVALTRDISERKRLEADHRKLEAQIQRAQKMESLGSLAGGVAHDMNNVLAAIMGMASVHMEKSPEGSPLHRNMATVVKACERGGTLVKGLLGFARQGLAEERAIDLNVLVREAVTLLERTTLQKVRLEADLAKALHPVLGDPASLTHAVMNLCLNAVDAMPQGGVLTLRTANDGPSRVRLEVADSGSGMPPEVLEKALDPFFTTKPQGKGTGLGLPIVYGTVKAHRGQMKIESSEGVGTTVSIWIPASAPASVGAEPVAPVDRARRQLRLLVVDDDELVQASLFQLLNALKHVPTLAGSGEEALQLLEEGLAADAVILDMNMPGLGGAATLPRIRVLRPALPVILATGRADQEAMDLVASDPRTILLAKPFSLEELRSRLQGIE